MPLTVPAYQNWKMCMRYEIFPQLFSLVKSFAECFFCVSQHQILKSLIMLDTMSAKYN